MKCKVCNAINDNNATRCQFCGSLLEKEKSSFDLPKGNSYYKEQEKYVKSEENKIYEYRPYKESKPMPQQSPPRYNQNNYNQQNYNTQTVAQTPKKTKPWWLLLLFTVPTVLVIFIIFVAFLFGGSFEFSYSTNQQIKDVINTSVTTDNVPTIESIYTDYETKIEGQKNLYKNDKYLIYEIATSEYLYDEDSEDSEEYCREFSIYMNLPTEKDNASYDFDKYGGNLECEDYHISIYDSVDFDEREEYIYVYDEHNDTLKRLNNLKIGELTFEVYVVIEEGDYGDCEYYLFSKPIDKDEHYLIIKIRTDEEIEPEDFIVHTKVEKIPGLTLN